jgi:hypothetical protein
MSQISHLFLYPRSPLLFRVGPRHDRSCLIGAPGKPRFFQEIVIDDHRNGSLLHTFLVQLSCARARAVSRNHRCSDRDRRPAVVKPAERRVYAVRTRAPPH